MSAETTVPDRRPWSLGMWLRWPAGCRMRSVETSRGRREGMGERETDWSVALESGDWSCSTLPASSLKHHRRSKTRRSCASIHRVRKEKPELDGILQRTLLWPWWWGKSPSNGSNCSSDAESRSGRASCSWRRAGRRCTTTSVWEISRGNVCEEWTTYKMVTHFHHRSSMKDLHLLPIGVLILSKVVIDTFVWHAEHRTKRKRKKNDGSCLSIHDGDVLGGFCLSFSLLLQSENPWTVLIIGESLNSPIQPKFVFSSCRTRSAESNRRWGSQKTAWLWLTSSRRRVVIYRSKFGQAREQNRAFPRILHFHPISLSNDGEDQRFSVPNRP